MPPEAVSWDPDSDHVLSEEEERFRIGHLGQVILRIDAMATATEKARSVKLSAIAAGYGSARSVWSGGLRRCGWALAGNQGKR